MVEMWLPPDIKDMTALSPKAYRIKTRPSVTIDAAILHQTGFSRGNVADRYKEVHAHFVVMPNGGILQLHPVEAYLVASSAFNDAGIAIEFVGNFPNEHNYWWPGDPGRHVPTAEQISAGCDLLRVLRDKHGVSFVFAHRQGELENRRGNCPGPDIWYGIGEWAKAHLQMDDGGKGYKEGNGSPIPDAWRKPRKTGKK